MVIRRSLFVVVSDCNSRQRRGDHLKINPNQGGPLCSC